ncbi:GntR family transcriptional regulator [Paracandidimonas lactea]|uniref:GntR family transcriptional regulator n=1 Tax=Paracandidimonas lactea TaxID=2895524 RepID=UPI001927984C|nr:GntR family transcriptional regulator [Paracandidimonas lactea]
MPNTSLNSAVMSRSRLPIYLQLAAEFRHCIESGAWPESQRLPTLEALMASYQVSRMTLRQALSVLESEGRISRARGKGSFVMPRAPQAPSLAIPTSWREAVALSDVLGTQSILESEQMVTELPPLGMACKGQPAAKYQYMCRLHSTDGQPFCYSEVYIDDTLFRAHKKRFKASAAASVLARISGLTITESRQKLTMIEAGFQSAHALRLNPGDSVAEVRRYACANDRIIYYARLEFPPRFVNLELDLLAH